MAAPHKDYINYYRLFIELPLKSKIDDFLSHHRVSLFSLIIACFKILMYRLTGESEVIVGMPVAGRNHEDTKDSLVSF